MALLSKIDKTASKMFVVPVLYLPPLKKLNRTPYEKTKHHPQKQIPCWNPSWKVEKHWGFNSLEAGRCMGDEEERKNWGLGWSVWYYANMQTYRHTYKKDIPGSCRERGR
jgi:hypothetical protein